MFTILKICRETSRHETDTAQKVSKYGVFSGPYFPVFSLNMEKYGPEKTLYVDTFHTVWHTDIMPICKVISACSISMLW